MQPKKRFHCGICYAKYRGELLGGEKSQEGKIRRFCLKKQKGEI